MAQAHTRTGWWTLKRLSVVSEVAGGGSGSSKDWVVAHGRGLERAFGQRCGRRAAEDRGGAGARGVRNRLAEDLSGAEPLATALFAR